jgi:hypothetical protein
VSQSHTSHGRASIVIARVAVKWETGTRSSPGMAARASPGVVPQRWFSPLASSLILALLWFGWHLPQFFLIATYRNLGAGGYVGMFFGLACGAVILTWLYNRSGGSILLVAVWHGLYNLVAGTQAAAGLLAAVVSA